MRAAKSSGASVPEGVAGKNGGRLTMAGIGRKRGVRNKLTSEMKALVRGALHAVGGQEYLERAARSRHVSERIAFLSLCGRVIPVEVQAEASEALVVNITTLAVTSDGRVIEQ